MSSLADLPELVGFFSYSRDDDEDSHDALSALRNRIQGELRSQLGRTTKTFRLWQDKEAIPSGTLWESEIKNAVAQSVFFVPIITPTVIASPYCRFELEAFLAREAELGRDDLVFPILYIDVPDMEENDKRKSDPVLALIARRQFRDWREFRHLDVNSTEVRREAARFCVDIRDALRRSWISPQERADQEQALARQQAEAERQRQDAEATRRVETEERRRQAEAQAQRIAEERRQQEREAKDRADQQRAFAAAKAADTANALAEFLAAYPDCDLADEARALHTVLVGRDDDYRQAVSGGDPAALKAFLLRYPDGKPAADIRKRLRRLEPTPRAQPSRRAMLIGGGAAGVGALALGAAFFTGQRPIPQRDASIRTLTGHAAAVLSVAIVPNGKTALSGSADNTLRLWDLASGETTRTLSGHTNVVRSVAIARDGRTALSGSVDGTARVWDLASGNAIRTLDATGAVTSVAISPDGRTALVMSGFLKIWDLSSGGALKGPILGAGRSITVTPDGSAVLAVDGLDRLTLWNVTTGAWIRTLEHSETAGSTLSNIAIAPDGSSALCAEPDFREHTLGLWDLSNGKRIRQLTGHTDLIYAVAIAPNGRLAVSGGADRTVRLWDLATGTLLKTFLGHTERVASVAIAPDSRTALSGSDDKTLKVWDLT